MLDNFKKQANILVDYLASINRKISHGQGLEAVARMHEHKSWNHAVGHSKAQAVAPESAHGSTRKPVDINRHRLSPAVSADGRTDDLQFRVEFDAAPWFATAADDAIFELYKIEWSGDYAADDVLLHFRGKHDEVTELFDYLDVLNRAGRNETVGFECSVSPEEALVWLKIHRPRVFSRILFDMAGISGAHSGGNGEESDAALVAKLEEEYFGDELSRLESLARSTSTDAATLETCARTAFRLAVLEVNMPDVFGITDSPDEIPEWAWIQANGAFAHRGNGVEGGVFEFMVHTSKAWLDGQRTQDVPVRLQPFFDEANRSGAAWVMFHQG
ncbi:glyoxalase superfamily protein [Burkholderia cenocepacia]|uniref:glyoxalase superfamily protein n=1 Tax=Burkholderia cenocepacia TaxID=95486 RepID=UPI0007614C67|nr:glyoxalase superfamily protein [Burkholderia cenocepacia]KWU19044.1 hypothetical protein AS149_12415 [Burkholderia cenocepacia]